MESNKVSIGTRIKKLRESKGETQAEVATHLCVKRETVNQWENNTRDLKTEYTIKLADYFNTTCDYILRGLSPNNVEINKILGLSEESIKKLQSFKYAISEYHNEKETPMIYQYSIGVLEAINLLIERDAEHQILWKIHSFLMSKHSNPNDPENAFLDLYNENTKEYYKISYSLLNSLYLPLIQNSLMDLKKELENEKPDIIP